MDFNYYLKRLGIVGLMVGAIAFGWYFLQYRLSVKNVIKTEHFIIQSSANALQSKEIAYVAEAVYTEYFKLFSELNRPILKEREFKLRLYKSREEFRFYNPMVGWAEAYYRKPYSHQYYNSQENNPYHWTIHELTHQLNEELAGFEHHKWLSEGLADYFGTSRVIENKLLLGEIDKETYPVWWIGKLASSGDLAKDKANLSVIPLRNIISGKNGPDINNYFNLYYLHWWSLTHFLFHYDGAKYQAATINLLNTNASVDEFEKHIGNIEQIEQQWYQYIQKLKSQLS